MFGEVMRIKETVARKLEDEVQPLIYNEYDHKREPDVFRSLSCFSIFMPTVNGFKLFRNIKVDTKVGVQCVCEGRCGCRFMLLVTKHLYIAAFNSATQIKH